MLYIGMEYLRLSNLPLAGEYFNAAFKICDSDPLLLNEMGVLAYHTEKSVYYRSVPSHFTYLALQVR